MYCALVSAYTGTVFMLVSEQLFLWAQAPFFLERGKWGVCEDPVYTCWKFRRFIAARLLFSKLEKIRREDEWYNLGIVSTKWSDTLWPFQPVFQTWRFSAELEILKTFRQAKVSYEGSALLLVIFRILIDIFLSLIWYFSLILQLSNILRKNQLGNLRK